MRQSSSAPLATWSCYESSGSLIREVTDTSALMRLLLPSNQLQGFLPTEVFVDPKTLSSFLAYSFLFFPRNYKILFEHHTSLISLVLSFSSSSIAQAHLSTIFAFEAFSLLFILTFQLSHTIISRLTVSRDCLEASICIAIIRIDVATKYVSSSYFSS